MPRTLLRRPKKKPRFSAQFIKRLSSWLALSTALTFGAARLTKAATLVWDSDQNPANGATDGSGS